MVSLGVSSCGDSNGGGGSPTGPGPIRPEIRATFQLSRTEVQNSVLPGQGEDALRSLVSVHVDAPDTLLRYATLYVTGYLPDQTPSPTRWERHLQTGIDAAGDAQLALESTLLPGSVRSKELRVLTRWDAQLDLADTVIERQSAFEITFLRPKIRVELSYQYNAGIGGTTSLQFAAHGPVEDAPGDEIPEPKDDYARCGAIVREYQTPNSQLVGERTIPACIGMPVYSLQRSPQGVVHRTLSALRISLDSMRRHLEVENCPPTLPCYTFEIDPLSCPLPGSPDGVENLELVLDLTEPLAFDWTFDGSFEARDATADLSIRAFVSY